MLAHEALRMGSVGSGQDRLPGSPDLLTPATMDHLGGEQADAAMAVLAVVPTEEAPAEGPGILDRPEA